MLNNREKQVVAGITLVVVLISLGASRPAPVLLQWKKSTPFPEPRAGYAAGVIHGKLVIAGGTYWEGTKGNWTRKVFTAATHAFDPVTQEWEKLPDAPIPLGYAASATVDNKLFVMGGSTGRETNRKIFTLENDEKGYQWTSFAGMPENRLFAGAVSIGSSIYLVGGTREFEPFDVAGTCCTSRTATNSVMRIDTRRPDKGWRQLASFPGARRWSFSTETEGRHIWIFGGSDQENAKDPVRHFDEVLRYTIANGVWERMVPLPKLLVDAAPLTALFVEDKILLMSFAKKVWGLDLTSLKYLEVAPLPEEVCVDRFFWLNDQIVGAGGENKIEGPRRRSEWTFIGRVK